MADLAVPARWPFPPHFGLDAAGPAPDLACNVEVFNGGQLRGLLSVWPPVSSDIDLQTGADGSLKRVALKEVRCVRLLQAIELPAPAPAVTTVGGHSVGAKLDIRNFQIQYHDDVRQTGTTRGLLRSRDGVYLYLAEGSRVTPWFVPATAGRVMVGRSPEEVLASSGVISPAQMALAAGRQEELRSKRTGEYLIERGLVSAAQLAEALLLQSRQPVMRLGDIVVKQGLIAVQDLRRALERQRTDHEKTLADILVEMKLVDRDTVTRLLGLQLGIPFVDAGKFVIEKDALELVSPSFAYLHRMIPLYLDGQTLVVASDRPLDQDFINELRFATGMQVLPVLGLAGDILARLQSEYGLGEGGEVAENRAGIASLSSGQSAIELIDLIAAQTEAPLLADAGPGQADESNLVRLVTRVILDAFTQGASDIHIETNPGNHETRIRFRNDGVLVDYMNLPASLRAAVVSRIKIMSELDISEHRRPQDGKIGFEQYGGVKLDLRVAVLPTSNGMEDVVMRLLASSRPMALGKLGLSERNLTQMRILSRRSYGMVLVCGPTGSGKTTTLHSVLADINTPELKIWTAEDPIEIVHAGLRQMQVNPKIGLTFASAMRSFLRADPDVIMVGEMRDTETAKIGIEASLTGHLVLSTLHTNGAAESIVRLLDLGMDPFNFSDALLGILAQRLVRRLCQQCKRPREAAADELHVLAAEFCAGTDAVPEEILAAWASRFGANGAIPLHDAVGCDACGNSGYKGRLGIHELLVSTPHIRELIQHHAPVSQLQSESMKGGMQTLRQDGIEKVLQGHTDILQVRIACN